MVNKAIFYWAGIAVICVPLLVACNQALQQAEAVPVATHASILPQATVISRLTPQPELAMTISPPTPSLSASETPLVGHEIALVVHVLDGDTIEVLVGDETYRLRYIGIDSPEDGQPFSAEATQANRRMVEGKKVLLEKDISETDRYDRLLRYVYLLDGVFINAELVRAGLAQAVAYPPDVRYQAYLESMQQEARQQGAGLWSLPAATAKSTLAGTATVPIAEDSLGEAIELPAQVTINPECSQFNAPGNDNDNKNEEYVCLTNQGAAPATMAGWILHDEYGWRYTFPVFSLAGGASARLRTGCGSNTTEDLYWCKDETAIWNNGGDCAYLLNSQGEIVSQYCY